MSTSNRSTQGDSEQALRRGLLAMGGTRKVLVVLCVLGLTVGHVAISRADNVCNGFIDFEYPVPPNPPGGTHSVGDKVTVKLDLGAGTITGGPMNILTITSIRFDMACSVPPLPAPLCTN